MGVENRRTFWAIDPGATLALNLPRLSERRKGMHAPNPTAGERYHRIQQLCAQLRQLVSSSAEQRGTLDRVLEEALRVADEIKRELKRRARAVEQEVGESCANARSNGPAHRQ
jgi:hypothetical protein